MSMRSTATDWWRMTPNPPCEPWCTAKHKADEFSSSAGLICFRTLLDTGEGRVDVQRTKHISLEGGTVQTEGATVWLETPHNSILDAERAGRLGEALHEAAEFLKTANS